jgi:predicted house-cleaning noncanonical NTP pyrophosphatase (MazG superfamily)
VGHKKLVRDKIPEIIRKSGKEPVTRVLDEKEYLAELVKKLKEEVAEFEADHSIEELADIKEVVIAIRDALNIRAGELEDVRREKAAKNGRFKNRIYLEDAKG